MRRTSLFVVALAMMAIGALAGTAGAQNSSDLIDQVDARGYATESTVEVDINRLESVADELNDDGVALVLLASAAANGNDLLAVEVVELAEREWTVLVLSPFGDELDVGYASATLSDDRLDEAGSVAFAQPLRDPLTFAAAFGSALESSGGSSGSGGGSGWLVFLVIVVVIGVGLFLWSRRSRAGAKDRIEQAKGELTDDLAAVANDILELGERPALTGHEEASDHFRTANEIYLEVDGSLAEAATIDQVDDLDDALELAGWHLDVTEALLDGKPVPERPRTDEVWENDTGAAADSLPRGRQVPPDRRAPAPAGRAELPAQFPRPAPRRSGGGLGSVLGGVLGGILSSGGLSGGGRRRGGFGGIGGGSVLGGPRSRGGLRPSPRSRPSGGSSRRPSTPRRAAAGRGRRRG